MVGSLGGGEVGADSLVGAGALLKPLERPLGRPTNVRSWRILDIGRASTGEVRPILRHGKTAMSPHRQHGRQTPRLLVLPIRSVEILPLFACSRSSSRILVERASW